LASTASVSDISRDTCNIIGSFFVAPLIVTDEDWGEICMSFAVISVSVVVAGVPPNAASIASESANDLPSNVNITVPEPLAAVQYGYYQSQMTAT